MKQKLISLIALTAAPVAWADSYTSTSATGAWNTARWNNSTDGSTYTSTYTAGNAVQFTSGSYSFGGMGASTNVGNVTLAAGVTVNFASIGSTYGTGGSVRTIDVGSGGLFDLQSQAISTAAGTGFIKNGTGTFALAGASYTGGFTVNSGTVIMRGVNAMGAGGALTINGGVIGANATRNLAGKYTGITVGGDFQLGVLASVVAISNDAANLTFDAAMNLGASNRKITVGANGNYALNGAISGSSGTGLTVDRLSGVAGVLVLGGANTFDGGVSLNGGRLQVTNSSALGTGSLTLNGSDTDLRLATTSGMTISNPITISDTGDTKQLSLFATTGILAGSISVAETTAGNFEIQSGAGDTLTISGNLTGSGGAGLKKTGSGTLVLAGSDNSLSGPIRVQNGVMQVTGGALSSASTLSVGLSGSANVGKLVFGGAAVVNQTVAGLSTEGTVPGSQSIVGGAAAVSTLTVNQSGGTSTFEGAFGGTGANENNLGLTKDGNGTLALTGTSTYTGNTTVSAGTLLVNGALGNTAVSVADGATVGGSGSIAGTLSFGGNSFFDVFLADPLAVTGTVSFGSGFGIDNILGINWDSVALDTPVTILASTQDFSTALNLQNFGIANAVPVGSLGRTAYFQNGSLQVMVVPEPAAILLGGLGMLGFIRRRR